MRTNPDLNAAVGKIWPSLSAPVLVKRVLTNKRALAAAASGILDVDEQALVQRRAGARASTTSPGPSPSWCSSTRPRPCSTAPVAPTGTPWSTRPRTCRPWSCGRWRGGAPRASMTVLGDLAQATAPAAQTSWRTPSSTSVAAHGLHRGARSSATACRARSSTSPTASCPPSRPGSTPPAPCASRERAGRDRQQPGRPGRRGRPRRRRDGRTVGLGRGRRPPAARRRRRRRARPSVRPLRHRGQGRPGGVVTLLAPPEAKGLEFDGVVVVEPSEVYDDERGGRLLYIALTRACRSWRSSTPGPSRPPWWPDPGDGVPGSTLGLPRSQPGPPPCAHSSFASRPSPPSPESAWRAWASRSVPAMQEARRRRHVGGDAHRPRSARPALLRLCVRRFPAHDAPGGDRPAAGAAERDPAAHDRRRAGGGGRRLLRARGRQHPLRRSARSSRNVDEGETVQGGSTITQQVVKEELVGNDQTLDRKAREAVLARRLEELLTKDEILERYLNTVYLGNGAYGVQAAAETYFDEGVADLDIGQSAFLAGLIAQPDAVRSGAQPRGLARRGVTSPCGRLVAVGRLDGGGARLHRRDAAADGDQPVQPGDAGLLRRGGQAGPVRRPAARRHAGGAPERRLPRRPPHPHDPRSAGAAAGDGLPQRRPRGDRPRRHAHRARADRSQPGHR